MSGENKKKVVHDSPSQRILQCSGRVFKPRQLGDIQTVTCRKRGFLSPCEKITEKGRAEEEGEGGRGRKKVSEGKEEGKRKIKKKRKGNIKI